MKTVFTQEVRKSISWILINTCGILAFLHFDSAFWAPADKRNLPGGPGDAFLWILSAFPILVLISVADFVWLYAVLKRIYFHREWGSFMIFLAIAILWGGVILLARSRHYVG